MKYMIGYISFVFLFLLGNSLDAQVLSDEHLLQSHKGTLTSSSNYSGNLDFIFEFVKEESDVKKWYELKLYHKNSLLNNHRVRIRNLIVTCYFEIELKDKKGQTKTLTAVYDKGNKWLRVKFAAQEGCFKPQQKWTRLSSIESFDDILLHIISEMDKNLVLDCYVE